MQNICDLSITVEPYLSVTAGHQVAEAVRFRILELGIATDVVVHVDVDEEEDLNVASAIAKLPSEAALVERAKRSLHLLDPAVEHVTLRVHFMPSAGTIVEATVRLRDPGMSLVEAGEVCGRVKKKLETLSQVDEAEACVFVPVK